GIVPGSEASYRNSGRCLVRRPIYKCRQRADQCMAEPINSMKAITLDFSSFPTSSIWHRLPSETKIEAPLLLRERRERFSRGRFVPRGDARQGSQNDY